MIISCLFPVEKFFRKKNTESSSWLFLLFLKLPMRRRLHKLQYAEQNSWYFVKRKSVGVTAVRKSEVGVSNPAADHNFQKFLDDR